MSDPLYAKDLLRLAAQAAGAGTLPHAPAHGSAHNPACGDRVSVDMDLDEQGAITGFAHDTKACVLAQASASILGAHLIGHSAGHVLWLRDAVIRMLNGGEPPAAPFADYAALEGARPYRNRHACVLLPIDAVLDAMGLEKT